MFKIPAKSSVYRNIFDSDNVETCIILVFYFLRIEFDSFFFWGEVLKYFYEQETILKNFIRIYQQLINTKNNRLKI